MRKVLKNKVVKYAVTAAMVMSVMMTTACNSKIKVDYGYNPTDYVELGDYKGIQAEVDVTSITNQVIDDKIAEQLESETHIQMLIGKHRKAIRLHLVILVHQADFL